MIMLMVLTIAMLSGGAQDTPIPTIPDENTLSSDRCPRGEMLLENECVQIPKLLKQKAPIYPELARRAKVEASVELGVTLLPDGTIGDIRVTKSSGVPKAGFEAAAIKAVKKWRYEPVRSHGKPISVQFTIKVDFFFTD